MQGYEKNQGQEKNAPGVCAACHQRGTGCCFLADQDTENMFGLTKGEIELIQKASGLAPQDFVVEDLASARFMAQALAIHPVFGQTMPGGRRLRLRVLDTGHCCFLGEQGCVLPLEARPLYCRLYPFWFTSDGRLMVLGSKTCLAQEGASSWQEVLKRLGENESRLRMLFDRLLQLAAENAQEKRLSSKP